MTAWDCLEELRAHRRTSTYEQAAECLEAAGFSQLPEHRGFTVHEHARFRGEVLLDSELRDTGEPLAAGTIAAVIWAIEEVLDEES